MIRDVALVAKSHTTNKSDCIVLTTFDLVLLFQLSGENYHALQHPQEHLAIQ